MPLVGSGGGGLGTSLRGCREGNSPEGEKCPHVQHGQQLRFRLGEGEAVTQRLEGRHNHRLLGVGQVQLDDRLPGRQRGAP